MRIQLGGFFSDPTKAFEIAREDINVVSRFITRTDVLA